MIPEPTKRSLSVLVAVDPVLRDAAAASLTLTSPGVVVVRHDLLPDDGTLRRVVVDADGVVTDLFVGALGEAELVERARTLQG